MEPLFFLYLAPLVAALLWTVRRWRTADLAEVAIMALWLVSSLRMLRTVGDAVLLTSPLVAAALSRQWPSLRRAPMLIGTCGLLALTGCANFVSILFYRGQDWRWTRSEPHCVKAAIERLDLSGRAYSPRIGKWLLWWFHSRLTVQFTWEYVAGREHWAEAEASWGQGPAVLQPYLERYQVDMLVLNAGSGPSVPYLIERGWALVQLDDRWLILARHTPETADLIARESYRVIRPWEHLSVTAANAPQVLDEAEQTLHQCPDHATFARAYKAEALRVLSRDRDAAEATAQIPRHLVAEPPPAPPEWTYQKEVPPGPFTLWVRADTDLPDGTRVVSNAFTAVQTFPTVFACVSDQRRRLLTADTHRAEGVRYHRVSDHITVLDAQGTRQQWTLVCLPEGQNPLRSPP